MAFEEYTSNQTVKAEQITVARSVITPNGPMAGAPGQWEVRFPDGNVAVVDDEQFQAAFGTGEETAETEPTAEPMPEAADWSEQEEAAKADREAPSEEAEETVKAEPSKTKAPPKPS